MSHYINRVERKKENTIVLSAYYVDFFSSFICNRCDMSSFHRSVEFADVPLSKNDNQNSSFAPLHRTIEVENLHSCVNEDKQLTSSTTKKILTKCFTVIGDGTEK